MVGVAAAVGSSFADRLISIMERVETRRVESPEEREAIYRLRYDAYLREGNIAPMFPPRLSDDFDDLPNSFIFGVYLEEQLVSSIRINVITAQFPRSPALTWFKDELGPEVAAGHLIIDPNRFVVDAAVAREVPELPYATVRLALVATEHFRADVALATVRDEHQAFYRRVFGFRPAIAPRFHPRIEKPFGAMMIRDFSARDGIMRRYPCFQSTEEERRRLFDRGPDDAASQVRGRNGAQEPAPKSRHLHVA